MLSDVFKRTHFIIKWILLSASFLLFPSYSFAIPTEIPGNGIPEGANGTYGACPVGYGNSITGTGCDLLLTGVDKDNDGRNSDGSVGWAGLSVTDCDDSDPKVYPGHYYACDAGGGANSGYKLCQTNGSYGSCVSNATPLCEATGSGVCKYVNCSSGSNSNSGTYASPYLTLGKVSGGAGGSPPSSPYSLNPGDRVYIVGSGNCSTTFNNGINTAQAYFSRDGTSSDWIGISRYPGSTATLNNTNEGGIQNYFGDYYIYDDLEITGADSTTASPFHIQESRHHRISRLYVHDVKGQAGNNFACGSATATSDTQIENSWLVNCKRYTGAGASGNADNITGFNWLDNTGDGNGDGHGGWNLNVWYSTYSSTDNGDCFRQKHGVLSSDVGAGGHPIMYSSCYQPRRGLQWQSSGLRLKYNFFLFSTSGYVAALYFLPSGEALQQFQDNIVQYNTFVNGDKVVWGPVEDAFDTTDSITVDHNIFHGKGAYAGDEAGIVIATYGSDSDYTTMWTPPTGWDSDYNCYYNPDNTFKVMDFSAGTADPSCPDVCDSGTTYTSLASWQAAHSKDTNSVNADASLGSDWIPGNGSCSTFGRLGTASTTTVGSTTTVPATNGGAMAAGGSI